jgi:putative peptide zinc metalloprotease protein
MPGIGWRACALRCAPASSPTASTSAAKAWIVLRDRFSHEWFRITPDAWAFLRRLGDGLTVEGLNAALEADAGQALTQEEVVQLLGQLNLSNLLQYDRGGSLSGQFERLRKRKAQELKSVLMGFLSIKVPLPTPTGCWTVRCRSSAASTVRWARWPTCCCCWRGPRPPWTMPIGCSRTPRACFPRSNLALLYGGFLLSKTLHELSHAAVCKLFGGEVHKIGVMLLLFAPVPYMDATSAWGFRSRAQRVLVGQPAACWPNSRWRPAQHWSGPMQARDPHCAGLGRDVRRQRLHAGVQPQSAAEFDGYHILVDLLDLPNLYQRSREQLRYLAERHVLRLPNAVPAARTPVETFLLPLYGVASLFYWVTLMVTIIVFVAGEVSRPGCRACIPAVLLGGGHARRRFLRYLHGDPRLGLRRVRAAGISVALAGGVLALLTLVPVPIT